MNKKLKKTEKKNQEQNKYLFYYIYQCQWLREKKTKVCKAEVLPFGYCNKRLDLSVLTDGKLYHSSFRL